jgi:hypothetical protein
MMNINANSTFDSMEDARNAIKRFYTVQKAAVKVLNNRPTNFHVKCRNEDCSFEISCNKRSNGLVHICRFSDEHTCMSEITGERGRVPIGYIVDRIKESISDNPNVTPATLRNAALREDGVNVSYMTSWRGKRKVINAADRDIEETFKLIGSF